MNNVKALVRARPFFYGLTIFIGALGILGERPVWGVISHFVSWKPFAASIELILPVPVGMTPQMAARRYLESLATQKSEVLGYLPQQIHYNFDCAPQAFETLPQPAANAEGTAAAPRMLVVANRFGHMLPDDSFPHVRQKLTSFGARVHTLPLSLHVFLNETELEELRAFVIAHYHGLVAIGGSDVHPSLYGGRLVSEPPTYLDIDRLELELLRSWLSKGRGALFGICRGHQLISVMLGCRLVQDLGVECPEDTVQHSVKGGDQATSLHNAWHPITLCKGSNSLLNAVGQKSFLVNSRHHQAVLQQDFEARGQGARVAALSGHVIEALELLDGRGFTVQFHPEDMGSREGDLIIQEMVRQAQRAKAQELPIALPEKEQGIAASSSSVMASTPGAA